MDRNNAERIIQAGLDCQANFVEIFEEETRDAVVSLRDHKVETASATTIYGIGLRLIYGPQVLYAYTSNDSPEHLLKLLTELAQSRDKSNRQESNHPKGQINGNTETIRLVGQQVDTIHSVLKDPRQAGQAAKLDILKLADETARNVSDKIVQVTTQAKDTVSHVAIYNSDGLSVEDSRTRCRFLVIVTAESRGEKFEASEAPGNLRGIEFFETLDVPHHTRLAAERALLMLDAGYVEGGQMPVVMGNGFGGVIFHEACGHPLETEMLRYRASPFTDKIGEKIAHESVTAIDDGTIANSWGSLNIDDEGMPTQRTVLIQDGVLQTYLADRVGAGEVGAPRTGSGRRQSYRFAPVSRMRNTYIDRGQDSFEDMIASVDEGLYAKVMGGSSVNPTTAESNFAVAEAYLIRSGKIAGAVRGATLIGKGHEILPRISMVGSNLELGVGMCGASSGSVPVTVGQPCLKVDSILVGGR